MSSHHEASYTEAQAEYNQNKNRFPDKLPSEYAVSMHNQCVHLLINIVHGKQLKIAYTSHCVLVYTCLYIAGGT